MAVIVQFIVAIVLEITGTLALRETSGFTRLWPTLMVCVCYPLSFFFVSRVLQHLEIGFTYAVWSAAGTAAMAVIGAAVFGESMNALKVASLVLVIVGVVGLQLSGARR
ncbi:cation/cationic drug transporter [Frankia casuarinae]|nr:MULTISPECIES: multidrug efflux SMR transporter [Frankia]ETA01714.1 cation/cationic drug transporter [Frankia sp. CcI6]EYT91729.1 cation/cationic drug transporter [Frankia casuarinae]KDA42389.1 cation/cationic drug transporter [Frankia sp. BMG5.23]KEZ35110.1 cation/cationic drug transporter [Frankia sp. CeD]KFB03844.1 cation/cationic drug transporter [Frankia sp. Allo2]